VRPGVGIKPGGEIDLLTIVVITCIMVEKFGGYG
jgi:hypothetical protein